MSYPKGLINQKMRKVSYSNSILVEKSKQSLRRSSCRYLPSIIQSICKFLIPNPLNFFNCVRKLSSYFLRKKTVFTKKIIRLFKMQMNCT